MHRILSNWIVAVALAGCDGKAPEPKPPPESPKPDRQEPMAGLEELERQDYDSVDPERAADILESVRTEARRDGDIDAGADMSARYELAFESIPHEGLRGPLGDLDDAAVFVVDDGSTRPNAVEILVVRRESGEWGVETLRSLGGPWRVRDVEELFVADAHDDGDVDLFVVGRFSTGAGAAADKRFGATIPYVWREGRFRYPNRLDDRLTDAASEQRALEILRLDEVIDR